MSALTLALPSKGRLQEQMIGYLADAGLHVRQTAGARGYAATLSGVDGVNLVLLSASEIASELIAGRVHFGVTGEDLLAEAGAGTARVETIERLGFGRANVVVAVPRAWIDVATMADLDDVAHDFHARHHRRLRVATKYLNLARDFFGSHGIADYRVVESLGATEGAPAAGTAEVIVDITTTGTTLAANHLKVLDDGLILESQAVLAASFRANWTSATKEAAQGLLGRISARQLGKTSYVVRARIDRQAEKAVGTLEGSLGVRVLSPGGTGDEVSLLVPRDKLNALVAALRRFGVGGAVSTLSTDYVFLPDDPLFATLATRLPS
ncbi:MAG: ATP phosphoribosyltransferase [Alphaproteobacteria bacterium]|nr:ATP phosphoribosyltransferase [Alphaproteobacteria bacterium]